MFIYVLMLVIAMDYTGLAMRFPDNSHVVASRIRDVTMSRIAIRVAICNDLSGLLMPRADDMGTRVP